MCRLAAGAALAAVAATATAAASMTAVATPAGAVTTANLVITRPGTETPLQHGGSTSTYSVVLPANASCPGDSATDGYRVYSYLVPSGVSPTQISFKGEQPSRYYGFVDYGAYFGAINTAQGTGQIVNLPEAFTWTRLTPTELFPHGSPATWEGGLACVNTSGQATDVWNAQIVFTKSSRDPGGFTWRVDQSPVGPAANHTWLFVGIGFLVVAAAAGATATYLSRRRPKDADGPSDADAVGGPGPDLPYDDRADERSHPPVGTGVGS